MKKFKKIFAMLFWIACLIGVITLICLLFTKLFWFGAAALMIISVFVIVTSLVF